MGSSGNRPAERAGSGVSKPRARPASHQPKEAEMFRIKTIAGAGLATLVLGALGVSAPVASANNPCAAPAECYGGLLDNHVVPLPPEGEPIINIVAEREVELTGRRLVVSCPQGQ